MGRVTNDLMTIDATERQLHIGQRRAIEIIVIRHADDLLIGVLKDL